MNIVDRLEYSNIQEYRIGDTECENLVLKALQSVSYTHLFGKLSN